MDVRVVTTADAAGLTAAGFIGSLEVRRSPGKDEDYRRAFNAGAGQYAEGDQFLGVRMGDVFALAKEYIDLPPCQIEILLESPIHEARVGALSIMDKQGRRKKTPVSRRQELYDLYLRHMDRIDNWDLVDLGAPYVVGSWLFDKPRSVLYEMARSTNVWERRTAIVSTSYFIRQGEIAETFGVAEILVDDEHDLVQKAVGGWLREAGKQDPDRLREFLGRHAGTMPRIALRYAIEQFEPEERKHYLGWKRAMAESE